MDGFILQLVQNTVLQVLYLNFYTYEYSIFHFYDMRYTHAVISVLIQNNMFF